MADPLCLPPPSAPPPRFFFLRATPSPALFHHRTRPRPIPSTPTPLRRPKPRLPVAMARRPRFCCFVARSRRPPAPISLLRPPLAAVAPCRSSRWTRLSSAAAPLLRPSSAPPPSLDRPDPVVNHATKPRPRPAFHRLADDLLRTGSSLDDPSPTSSFDSSPDPEVLVVPPPRCVLRWSSPTAIFVQSPRKGDDQQHRPHRATAKT
nr:proline-rich receptor-like protein kinase PERK8 [Aegilops tauschii subsp. strangulata]